MVGDAEDEGYDFSDPFDSKKWAMHHDRQCTIRALKQETRWVAADLKLGIIQWAGAAAALTILGMLSWSLKTNYDNLEAQHQVAAALPQTINQTAEKASSETVQKLSATNAATQ